MCGIAGFWDFQEKIDPSTLNSMHEAMAYRGPDDYGTYYRDNVGLVHRRLAIRDLSPLGAQPMHSRCGRYVLVYNGEIYNHTEITYEPMQGHSDTEALLQSCSYIGVLKTVPKLIGMFAFALWDQHEKSLYLVRDRLGIKPMYYGFNQGNFFFASDLNAIVANPNFQAKMDMQAVALYLRLNYIPAPHSIYQGIYKQQPGTILKITQTAGIKETTFWSIDDYVSQEKIANPQEELHALLRDSVRRRLIADVPFGAFLSGGIDSSLVVALMQELQQVNTFSIGFSEEEFNEAHHAKKIAKHLGTNHHELYVDKQQALDLITDLPHAYGEPFADSSQIPTMLLSKLTQKYVKVALSGDGGDELFAGYNRYSFVDKWWPRFKTLSPFIKKSLAWFLQYLPHEKFQKASRIIDSVTLEHFYQHLVSYWNKPQQVLHGDVIDPFSLQMTSNLSDIEQLQLWDSKIYLPDDVLTKVDRASMYYSLEVRVPLLDHRIVQMSWQIDQQMKIQNGQGKLILKQILAHYLPKNMFERPKMGFGIPLAQWLRENLKDQLFSSIESLDPVMFNKKLLFKCFHEHMKGKKNHHYQLWGIMMFALWQQKQKHVV